MQLKLPAGADVGDLELEFRAPDVNRDNVYRVSAAGAVTERVSSEFAANATAGFAKAGMSQSAGTESLSSALRIVVDESGYAPGDQLLGGTGASVIWLVSGGTGVLISEVSSAISANDVNATPKITLALRRGRLPDGTVSTVRNFSDTFCQSASCTLKLAIVTPPVIGAGIAVPYLEYRIVSPSPIPEQWIRITAEGYERGYRKSAVREVRQTTTNEAMDFTVFQ